MSADLFSSLSPTPEQVREILTRTDETGWVAKMINIPATDYYIKRIGPHRLYLGDAYAIRETLGWMDVDCMDPPFLFKAVGAGQMRKKRQATNMIIEEKLDEGFDHAIINPLRAGMVIVFCHNDQIPELGTYLKARFKRFIVGGWAKDNPMPVANKHFLYDTDYFYVAWNHGHHPVGDIADKPRFIPAPVAPSKVYGHPTVKPDKVMDRLMRNIAGQTVCDPFMGTGSTGVAAIRAGKTFTGIEHNPKHFETAVSRIGAAYLEGVAK